MTGPVNTVKVGLLTCNLKRWPSWQPGSITNRDYIQGSRTIALRHPQLVHNAKRPDGTRPMSSWSKDWFQAVGKPTSWGVRPKPGTTAWCADATNDTVLSGTLYTSQPSTPAALALWWENLNAVVPFSPSLAVASDQVARTKVLGKLSQKKWDIGVTALELKQTAGLVTDLSVSMVSQVENLINFRKKSRRQLNEFFRDIRRQGSFDKAAVNVGLTDISLLNDLRSAWMQYQFGVKPALMDIDNAVTFLADAIHQSDYKVLVRAKAGHTSDRDYVGRASGMNPTVGMVVVAPRLRETCTTHYSVVYELPTGHVRTRTALGLDNPGAIAWEVTRLSWMVDYVVGVGDWLQSFTATNGMVFREGCRSTLRRVITMGFDVTGVSSNGILSPAPDLSGSFFERGTFRRELLARDVTPAFMPQIKSQLGLVQLANSLFAMSSVLGGKPGLR